MDTLGVWVYRWGLSVKGCVPTLHPFSSEAAQAREGELREQLAAAQRDSHGLAKASRAVESSSSALEARLTRATEDAERCRAQLQSERAEAADREKDLKGRCEALSIQLKRAERQRGELLTAFKKQMRLIDVLKRQRIHVSVGGHASWLEVKQS